MLSEQASTDDAQSGIPRLSPDFLIETYLDHQVSPSHHPVTQHKHLELVFIEKPRVPTKCS